MSRLWRRARAPLRVAAARLRAHPGPALLVLLGVAASTAMLVSVLGGSVIARDREVQKAVAALPESERSFQVDAFGLPQGQDYRAADRAVRRELASLTPRTPLRAHVLPPDPRRRRARAARGPGRPGPACRAPLRPAAANVRPRPV